MSRATSGSSATSKRIAYAVQRGCKVTFSFSAEWSTTGYVIAMDDYHWICIDPETLDVSFVHKSCPLVCVAHDQTFEGEDRKGEMEPILSSFRERLVQEHLSPRPTMSAPEPKPLVRA